MALRSQVFCCLCHGLPLRWWRAEVQGPGCLCCVQGWPTGGSYLWKSTFSLLPWRFWVKHLIIAWRYWYTCVLLMEWSLVPLLVWGCKGEMKRVWRMNNILCGSSWDTYNSVGAWPPDRTHRRCYSPLLIFPNWEVSPWADFSRRKSAASWNYQKALSCGS